MPLLCLLRWKILDVLGASSWGRAGLCCSGQTKLALPSLAYPGRLSKNICIESHLLNLVMWALPPLGEQDRHRSATQQSSEQGSSSLSS